MKKSSSSNSSKGGKGRGGASDSSSPSTAPASSSFSSQRLTQLFDSFLSDDPEEDRQSLPQEGIVKFAQAMGIEDPEGVRRGRREGDGEGGREEGEVLI
ncbi:Hypothetical protein NocV09_01301960 [Nannochloropsis oceanica]